MKTLEEETSVGTRDIALFTGGCNGFLYCDILSIKLVVAVVVVCRIGQKQGT